MSERDPQLEPVSDDLADLFAAERARPSTRDDRRGRVRDRLGATLGIPALSGGGGGGDTGPTGGGPSIPAAPIAAGATGAAANAAAASVAAGAAGAGTKLAATIAAVLALGGAAVVGARALHSEPTPLAASVASAASDAAPVAPVTNAPNAPTGDPAATSAPAPRADPAPVATADEPAPAPTTSAAAAPSSAPDAGAPGRDVDLATERELLDSARAAIARGQGSAAIALLERHAKDFARGRLGEEREALWIRALVASGRIDDARARAARFKRSFPRSLQLPAFEETLGPLP